MDAVMQAAYGAAMAPRGMNLRGLGQTGPNQSAPTTCPECPKTNPIWYIGTAIGAICLIALVLPKGR